MEFTSDLLVCAECVGTPSLTRDSRHQPMAYAGMIVATSPRGSAPPMRQPRASSTTMAST